MRVEGGKGWKNVKTEKPGEENWQWWEERGKTHSCHSGEKRRFFSGDLEKRTVRVVLFCM